MRFPFFVALFGAIASASSPALAVESPGCGSAIQHGRRIERTADVGGVAREYILDVPRGVGSSEPVPLLFDFHGFGHSGAGVWQVSGFRALAKEHGFITVYPTGLPIVLTLRGQTYTNNGWQMEPGTKNRDLRFVRAMLAEIGRDYCIDLDRVYATGFSNGAFFSSLLGCEMSETFAAVAPVSGGSLRSPCKPKRPVPVMIHHGSEDTLITVDRARASRDQWLDANGCGAAAGASAPEAPACMRYEPCRAASSVVYCEERFAHRWPSQATQRIWRFLARFTR